MSFPGPVEGCAPSRPCLVYPQEWRAGGRIWNSIPPPFERYGWRLDIWVADLLIERDRHSVASWRHTCSIRRRVNRYALALVCVCRV